MNLSATFGLKPLNMHANVEIAKAIDMGRFLPPQVAAAAGRFVHGRLRANGDTEEGFALDSFDLALGLTPHDRSLRLYRGRIFTDDAFDTIRIEKVAVSAGRNNAVFDGWVKPVADEQYITINGDFPDLGVWLERFGVPAYVTSARGGTIVIRGKITAPTVTFQQYELGGVPCLDQLHIDTATVINTGTSTRVDARVRSTGLGGELVGKLSLDAGGVVKRIDQLSVAGRGLDAGKLCGLKQIVKGGLDTVEAEVTGATIDPNRPPLEVARSRAGPRAREQARGHGRALRADRRVREPPRRPGLPPPPRLPRRRRPRPVRAGQARRLLPPSPPPRAPAAACSTPPSPSSPAPGAAAPTGSAAPSRCPICPLGLLEQVLGKKLAGGLASAKLHLAGSLASPEASGGVDPAPGLDRRRVRRRRPARDRARDGAVRRRADHGRARDQGLGARRPAADQRHRRHRRAVPRRARRDRPPDRARRAARPHSSASGCPRPCRRG